MGKLFGFDLVRSRQVGSGGPVYDGGNDPNQEGRGIFGPPPFIGNWKEQYGGAVQTRANRTNEEEEEAAEIAAALAESRDGEERPARGTRMPPKPPPPVRGARLYRDNDLQRFMTALNLNYKTKNKRTRAHQRLMGWKMHGSNAGDARENPLSRLIRQSKGFAVLNWKAGHKDLKFPPTPSLLRKYYNVMNTLGYLENPAPTIAEATGKNRRSKATRVRKKKSKAKVKAKSGKKKGSKKKKKPSSPSLIGDLNLAEDDIQSAAIEPLAGTSQEGSGVDLKTLLQVLNGLT